MLEIRGSKGTTRRARNGRLAAAVAAIAALLGLAGCAQSVPLPDLVKDPQKILTKDEQKRAIADLSQGKERAVNAAEKQIKKGR